MSLLALFLPLVTPAHLFGLSLLLLPTHLALPLLFLALSHLATTPATTTITTTFLHPARNIINNSHNSNNGLSRLFVHITVKRNNHRHNSNVVHSLNQNRSDHHACRQRHVGSVARCSMAVQYQSCVVSVVFGKNNLFSFPSSFLDFLCLSSRSSHVIPRSLLQSSTLR